MKWRLLRKKFNSVLGLNEENVEEKKRGLLRNGIFAAALAFALTGAPTPARAAEDATLDGDNVETTQVLSGDDVTSYTDVETPEIFVDSSDVSYEEPVVEETVSYEEPAVEETVSYEEPVVEETVSYEEPVVEETVSYEEPVVEETVTGEAPVIEEVAAEVETPSAEETTTEEVSTPEIIVENNADSAETTNTEKSSTISSEGSNTEVTTTTTVEEQGDYIIETEYEETKTTKTVDWSFYVFEAGGRRFVFTEVDDNNKDAKEALSAILDERYGNDSQIPTDIYEVSQLHDGRNVLTYGGVNLIVNKAKDGTITVLNYEITNAEHLDGNLEPVKEDTETKNDEQPAKTDDTKQSGEESNTTSNSQSTVTENNVYNIPNDSYVLAVDKNGSQSYLYIGGMGVDLVDVHELMDSLKKEYPELFADNKKPILVNGIKTFDSTDKTIIRESKFDRLIEDNKDRENPYAETGDKPYEEPPQPTPPTPTPPTPTPPVPTPPVPTPPTPTPPVPTSPVPALGGNIPKTGDSGSLLGSLYGVIAGSGITMYGLSSLRKRRAALLRESIAGLGYIDLSTDNPLARAVVKKYGNFKL